MYQQALIPDIYWFLSCQWELYWKRKALLVFNAVCTSHTHFTCVPPQFDKNIISEFPDWNENKCFTISAVQS